MELRFRLRSSLGVAAAAFAIGQSTVASAQAARGDGFAVEAARLTLQHDPLVPRGERPVERRALGRLYSPTEGEPLWSRDGRPTPQALRAIELLARAHEKGLVASDYRPDTLRVLAEAMATSPADASDAARFDVVLSRSVLHFLADLHLGRVPPNALGFHLPESHEGLDLARYALDASRAADVAAVISSAEPPYAGYAALERTLGRYRALAGDARLRPPVRPRRPLHPGDPYRDLPALARLLVASGDLAPAETLSRGDSARDTVYEGAVVEGVAAFQRRHALVPDSVLGPATLTELRVPMAARVRQIELTLERWRWLPDRPPERYAVVNVPGFRLYAFEHDSIAAQPALAMNVIVGEARGRHSTPVFAGTMRQIVFRPYWDVPRSIARKELIPLIRRDPGYAERNAFEIVRGGEDDAVIYPMTSANLWRVADGTLRLRQRPGDDNSLGLLKFVFPNDYDVYLHGTPATALFARSRRDFSHGCIRVEDPAALAELVLRGQPGWDRAAIDSAMHGDRTIRVDVARPVTVFILYSTVVARDAGTVYFYPDLYGHDARLARALARP